MTRFALAAALAAAGLVGCTPCARIATAEADATQKGKACNGSDSTWSSAKQQTCEANLSKCTQDDVKWLNTYADCLQKLPSCAEGQGLSFGLARLGCLESYSKVSLGCISAIN
jgi:hypothetical protein